MPAPSPPIAGQMRSVDDLEGFFVFESGDHESRIQPDVNRLAELCGSLQREPSRTQAPRAASPMVLDQTDKLSGVGQARPFRIVFVRARTKLRSFRARCDKRSRAEPNFARHRGPLSQAVCHAAANSTGRFAVSASMSVSA
jgi:hypothetical protein